MNKRGLEAAEVETNGVNATSRVSCESLREEGTKGTQNELPMALGYR